MNAFLQFIFATILILTVLCVFIVVLVGGWIVGTVYLWVDGTTEGPVRKIAWWKRSKGK